MLWRLLNRECFLLAVLAPATTNRAGSAVICGGSCGCAPSEAARPLMLCHLRLATSTWVNWHSWLARHPRRSHQAYWEQYMEAEFIDDNLPPRAHTLPELWSWYQQLVAEEST
jgi:hypothetical protein